MAALTSLQQLSALQYPWHVRRARPSRMQQRTTTPCSSSQRSTSRVTSPVDKESLRRQIVGLAVKREAGYKTGTSPSPSVSTPGRTRPVPLTPEGSTKHTENDKENQPSSRLKYSRFSRDHLENKMPQIEPHEALKNALRRSKTTMNTEHKSKPKIVRFRMDELSIGGQKASIVKITDPRDTSIVKAQSGRNDSGHTYEIRGNAMNVRKEGLKGLLEYKDMCTEHERRQTSLHTSLKLFRRRIKLNEEKFIQPNETTTDDYVIHRRSPFCEVQASPVPDDTAPPPRPLSSNDHLRLLRSALHTKHNGGSVVKHTETTDIEETTNNIKCSYRLPENPNWSKEVSFKDIKDDSIPSVKTYVVEEDKHPNAKFRKNSVQHTVTLNIHNLNVHNSISQINSKKVKVGDSEVSFDPRFLDWIEDSVSNVKQYKDTSVTFDEKIDCTITPTPRRRISSKS